MYPFCNKAPLVNLKAEGSGNVLIFETPSEKAQVMLSDFGSIVSVTHMNLIDSSEYIIENSEAHHIVVGESNWQQDVYHFLKPNPIPHLKLRLGFTVHRGEGTWSSLPHHFETHPEPGFEEVFFYVLSGDTKRAFQVGRGVWMDNVVVDDVWPIRDRVFGVIPMGYHPVVGEPGVKVTYIWAYLAKHKHWEKI